mmetsp:Transcript_24310/g.54099  ORF Transcript_24310/g.54099 Transcript_24310/m.54099 type:complete len:223 (-) Transcript_24310:2044-2712(-)
MPASVYAHSFRSSSSAQAHLASSRGHYTPYSVGHALSDDNGAVKNTLQDRLEEYGHNIGHHETLGTPLLLVEIPVVDVGQVQVQRCLSKNGSGTDIIDADLANDDGGCKAPLSFGSTWCRLRLCLLLFFLRGLWRPRTSLVEVLHDNSHVAFVLDVLLHIHVHALQNGVLDLELATECPDQTTEVDLHQRPLNPQHVLRFPLLALRVLDHEASKVNEAIADS